MADILKPGDGFIFMKVGTHAKESLEDIIKRKAKEIDDSGFAMWGYGGSTCHPERVQAFAHECATLGDRIFLCMEPMKSMHFAEPIRAEEYSVDGVDWQPVDKNVNVRGSRHALVLKSLELVDFELALADSTVAIGNSIGLPADQYIRGRVDKACLRLGQPNQQGKSSAKKIGLAAELAEPYAVFLRNRS